MDSHIACLTDLCRICGDRFSRDDRRYSCFDHRDGILKYYQTDIENDNRQLHPPSFCFPCYMAMFNCERSRGALTITSALKMWLPHSDDCSTCLSCKQQRKGGRPSKKVKKRTVATGRCFPQLQAITERIEEVAPEAHCPESSSHLLVPTQFIRPTAPLTISHFQCGLCNKVLNSPVELSCNHLFCKVCFLESVTSGNYDCPTCHKSLTDVENIKCPSPITLMSLASLRLTCTKTGCRDIIKLDTLKEHQAICGQTTQSTQSSAFTPQRNTLEQALNVPFDQTPNTLEKRVATHVIRRMVNSSCEQASDDYLSLKTGGKVSNHSFSTTDFLQ